MSGPLRLTVDKTSPVPLYHQVAQGLEDAIRSGELPPGTKLDNEIDLANRLNLSRPTMRKAMDELVRAGLLVRKRGVGTQVVGGALTPACLKRALLYQNPIMPMSKGMP